MRRCASLRRPYEEEDIAVRHSGSGRTLGIQPELHHSDFCRARLGPLGVTANLSSIRSVADNAGNVYQALLEYSVVVRIDPSGALTLVAGGGTHGFGGDGGDNGRETLVQLDAPGAVDAAGAVYISDFLYDRIRRVSNGVITTVAGGGSDSSRRRCSGPQRPAGVGLQPRPDHCRNADRRLFRRWRTCHQRATESVRAGCGLFRKCSCSGLRQWRHP